MTAHSFHAVSDILHTSWFLLPFLHLTQINLFSISCSHQTVSFSYKILQGTSAVFSCCVFIPSLLPPYRGPVYFWFNSFQSEIWRQLSCSILVCYGAPSMQRDWNFCMFIMVLNLIKWNKIYIPPLCLRPTGVWAQSRSSFSPLLMSNAGLNSILKIHVSPSRICLIPVILSPQVTVIRS